MPVDEVEPGGRHDAVAVERGLEREIGAGELTPTDFFLKFNQRRRAGLRQTRSVLLEDLRAWAPDLLAGVGLIPKLLAGDSRCLRDAGAI